MKKLAMYTVFGVIALMSISCAGKESKGRRCKSCSSLGSSVSIENVS
ncbi:MAG: hypothetical protein S4CHLAM20_13750 [Chlamydiia bacterium]|nr:hypothetical protein [Chlamydiia bacterium]